MYTVRLGIYDADGWLVWDSGALASDPDSPLPRWIEMAPEVPAGGSMWLCDCDGRLSPIFLTS